MKLSDILTEAREQRVYMVVTGSAFGMSPPPGKYRVVNIKKDGDHYELEIKSRGDSVFVDAGPGSLGTRQYLVNYEGRQRYVADAYKIMHGETI